MKERPILFSREMVRAILDGRKTQTRRVAFKKYCPYGKPGDRLWVRETWSCGIVNALPGIVYYASYADDKNWFRHLPCVYGDLIGDSWGILWNKYQDRKRPSIYMPRWASRILLEIVNIRLEHLHDINESDAQQEGWDLSNIDLNKTYDPVCQKKATEWFHGLWDSINGKRGLGWEKNPLVWVIEFKRIL